MIFVTVGTDGPFNRLIDAVDRWAVETGRTDVVAQIGHTDYRPRAIQVHQFLDPVRFRENFSAADLVIAHAGMGTILSALRYEKPLLVMPRRASLGEQRNEHQLATATHLQRLGKVTVAFDEVELRKNLEQIESLYVTRAPIGAYAEARLTSALHGFIHATGKPLPLGPALNTEAEPSSR